MDIGNSRLKWGLLDEGAIRQTGHISMIKVRDDGLAALTSRLPRDVETVFASNVAGTSFATRLTGVIGMHCDCEVRFARTARTAGGITNGYAQPRRLGVDRWLAMIGAWAEFKCALAVVDAGTATTIDGVDDSGRHLGGLIMPGLQQMASSLATGTNDTAAVRLRPAAVAKSGSLFAGSTTAAVNAGAINAHAGAVERVRHLMRSDGHDAQLVLTGGDAARILTALEGQPAHRPHLVLHGLAQLLENC
jgi:type III pantothenate kinase